MKNFLIACIFTIGLGFGDAPAKADPGPIVNWLMNEPVSLFDLGMLRLKKDAEEAVKNLFGAQYTGLVSEQYLSFVQYDYAKNRIQIGFDARRSRKLKFEKAACKKHLGVARFSMGTVVEGKVVFRDASDAALNFTHVGYSVESQPKDLAKKLDDIITVEIFMDGGSCFGSLVSEDVFYRDE